MLRKSPIDAASVEMNDGLPPEKQDSLGPSALFDDAISDFKNTGKYRTCDFGLPTLNAGLGMLDRHAAFPH